MTENTLPAMGANGGALPALSDDLLNGAKAIAQFMYGEATITAQRRVYHAAENLGMPTFRIGKTICSRRSTILRWIEEQERRSSAA